LLFPARLPEGPGPIRPKVRARCHGNQVVAASSRWHEPGIAGHAERHRSLPASPAHPWSRRRYRGASTGACGVHAGRPHGRRTSDLWLPAPQAPAPIRASSCVGYVPNWPGSETTAAGYPRKRTSGLQKRVSPQGSVVASLTLRRFIGISLSFVATGIAHYFTNANHS